MRTIHGLFLVGVALFVFGIGFIVAGARAAREAAPPAPIAATVTPVATVRQIMNAITGPAATAVYEAVSTTIDADGITEVAPETDEDWAALADSAAALIESGNLLLMSGRAVDQGDWVTMTKAFMDAGQEALRAAEAQDTEGILTAGSTVNETCDSCHARYRRD
ncbi:MAG: hypothetical protein AB7G23_03215 [Vicinamibacterales bacterium]